MKKIPLTKGKVALVDDLDYEYLSQWEWYCGKSKYTFYATRPCKINGKQAAISMHCAIMRPPKGMQVDHRDGNGLDNRRANMRVCTHAENSRNKRLGKKNTSGYKGVHWSRQSKKWQAKIKYNYRTYGLGYYFCIVRAAKAYDEAAKLYFGEFARVNF